MTFEGLLGVPAPHVSEAQAVALVGELYRLGPRADLRAEALPGEYDANFRVTATGGRRFVLKVMHPARERSLVELQCAALQHLARTAPDLPLPRVQPLSGGELMRMASMPDRADGAGASRIVWMLSFIEGTPFAEVRPQTDEMLQGLGRFLGRLDRGLSGFAHPASERDFKWDLSRAAWIEGSLQAIADPERRSLVGRILAIFKTDVAPVLPHLRRSVIHSDANDYNVLVGGADQEPREIASLIDFGDMHLGLTVAEVAIGATYALLGRRDPLGAAARVIRGYHTTNPLDEREVAVLFPLILARLAVSVTNSALRKRVRPDDAYVTISEEPAWEALERLVDIPAALAHATFRHACRFPVTPRAIEVASWIRAHADRMMQVLDVDLRTAPSLVFDLSVGSTLLGADPRAAETNALTDLLFGEMRKEGVSVGVGRYDEARLFYVSPLFDHGQSPLDERRTVHLGIDLFAEPGSRVRTPLDGVVHILAHNHAPQDYGPLVILKHTTHQGPPFFTLYGHLSEETLQGLTEGQTVAAGEEIARVGSAPTNGDWAPHLHFQIILDLLGLGRDFPGVCRHADRELWKALSPDPNLILGIPRDRLGAPTPSAASTMENRRRSIGGGVRVSYQRPLKIVRGFGAYLYDETGRAFLDMYNNVPLVGHSHPKVVRAVQAQLGLLNTNTRYLHDNVVRYAERLRALMPDSLRVCFFVNSGSEANDLALRMARSHTRREDVIVLEHAYHGHTSSLIDVSPYKFSGLGGRP